jgi:hypothetical protein
MLGHIIADVSAGDMIRHNLSQTLEGPVRKHLLAILSVLSVLLTLACAPPSVMVRKEPPPTIASIKPEPGKAALVISRTTSIGFAIEFTTYLGKTYIGSTKGKSYFIKTDVEPGANYVSSWGENGVAVKFDFEPDKVYCLQQNVSMGWTKARVVMEAVNVKRLDSGDLNGCKFFEFDAAKNTISDLTDDEFKDVIRGADAFVLNADGTAQLVPATPN